MTTPPEVDGFVVLDTPPATEDDIVKAYLDYRRTGGEPIRVWERRLKTRARQQNR